MDVGAGGQQRSHLDVPAVVQERTLAWTKVGVSGREADRSQKCSGGKANKRTAIFGLD